MADYKRYLEKKEKGLAELVKINGSYAVSFKKFDTETGEEVTPEVQALGRDELLTQKSSLEADVSAIDSIISELDLLDQE